MTALTMPVPLFLFGVPIENRQSKIENEVSRDPVPGRQETTLREAQNPEGSPQEIGNIVPVLSRDGLAGLKNP